jgi:S-formylglutathione hydrolase FrmB
MSAQASDLSLMGGWLPFAVQSMTLVALVLATGWRTRCWRVASVPSSIAIGAVAMVGAYLMLQNAGVAGEPAPKQLWVWTAITGFGVGILVLGWRTSRWARRNAAVFAVSFSLLSTGLVINGWIGYFPTVGVAWNQLTNRPLPGQTSLAAVNGMRARGERPSTGRLVAIETGSAASGFRHRTEWAYLPPAWFSSSAGPMPAVMMIGGEFNTPADWIRAGEAVSIADSFAGSHGGRAPVLVFVDPSGSFTADTECVNGVRGNAADHLTEDVMPHVISLLGVSADEAQWAVAGFSSGGTCAVDLAVMHPDVFRNFVDIGGDERPNAGTDTQTVQRLFGGDRDAFSAFDPATAISRHGAYSRMSGLFIVPEGAAAGPGGDVAAAHRLCRLGASRGISCSVRALPGRHDWPFAGAAFSTALPWLADRLNADDGERARG